MIIFQLFNNCYWFVVPAGLACWTALPYQAGASHLKHHLKQNQLPG
jgi:hypothetical protein